MGKNPAYQIYPGDILRSPDLRKCSWEVRGIWWDILAHMWFETEQGKMTGTKDELCRVIGCTEDELGRFFSAQKAHKFCNVTNRNGRVTIINRRMYRAYLARAGVKNRVARHREKKCNTNVTPPSPTPTPSPCNNTVTFINPTLQDCLDAASLLAIPQDYAKKFFEHYQPQGWKWGGGVAMTDIRGALQRCWTKGYTFKIEFKNQRNTPVPPSISERLCTRCGKNSDRFVGNLCGSCYDAE